MQVNTSDMEERVGGCNRCGECCKKLGWLLVHADDDTAEWIRAHDPRIEAIPDDTVADYYWISIPYPCVHLHMEPDGKYICKLHDRKPRICREYPTPTDTLKPGCGYRFK